MAPEQKSRPVRGGTGRTAPDVAEGEIALGYLSGVFGIRGEHKLFLYNPSSDLFDQPVEVALLSPEGDRFIVGMRVRSGAGKRIIARVEGVEGREHAEELVGFHVVLPKTALPELDEDTWYHHELLGLRVETDQGTVLGRLTRIHPSGGVDMWVVHGPLGECWVPFKDGNVLSVAPGERAVVAEAAVLRLSDGI